MPIQVDVVSQEKMLFSEPEADMVLIPGREGVLGVLPHHTPLLTTMKHGELIIRKGNAEESFAIYGGVVEVRPDKVVVLADAADFTAEINLEEARQARERALKLLEEGVPAERRAYIDTELRRAELAIDLHMRLKGRGKMRIKIIRDDED